MTIKLTGRYWSGRYQTDAWALSSHYAPWFISLNNLICYFQSNIRLSQNENLQILSKNFGNKNLLRHHRRHVHKIPAYLVPMECNVYTRWSCLLH